VHRRPWQDELDDIFRASHARLVIAVFALTGDLAEAQDAVAEAFARAVAHRSTVLAADNPEAWLRTVARNIARRRWRRATQLVGLLRRTAASTAPMLPEMSPDRVMVMAAIRRLPADQRETVALYYIADLSVEQIAQTLGQPAGTVKSRLSRARSALAALLAESAPEATSTVRGGK
jgi:RNA polymerase sigma-70 factor (ECF subfamily)